MKHLARLSAQMLKEGRIKNQKMVEGISAQPDPQKALEMFWAVPFDRMYNALMNAFQRGSITQEDLAIRMHLIYGRVAEFIEHFWQEQGGWTEDFGPTLDIYQQAQVDLAISTPADQLVPNPTVGEILEQRR